MIEIPTCYPPQLGTAEAVFEQRPPDEYFWMRECQRSRFRTAFFAGGAFAWLACMLALALLRIASVISWPWALVLSPLWAPFAVLDLLLGAYVATIIACGVIDRVRDARS